MSVTVSDQAFDPGTVYARFLAEADGAGAGVCFTGIVRSVPERPILALVLECYPELAAAEITGIHSEAVRRFSLAGAAIIHRHGRLLQGEPIMQVMTLAPHRTDAFAGAEFLMDYLKTDAPFWKKEVLADGEHWVEAKPADDAARARWG